MGVQERAKHEKHIHRMCFSCWRLGWGQECSRGREGHVGEGGGAKYDVKGGVRKACLM